ncbi:MAG: hypothetical protein ACK559_09395 [bacterium]
MPLGPGLRHRRVRRLQQLLRHGLPLRLPQRRVLPRQLRRAGALLLARRVLHRPVLRGLRPRRPERLPARLPVRGCLRRSRLRLLRRLHLPPGRRLALSPAGGLRPDRGPARRARAATARSCAASRTAGGRRPARGPRAGSGLRPPRRRGPRARAPGSG